MKSFLERMGVYGYSYPHERAMLASILTGTPLLLIGHIGEAKTKAAEAMAALLGEPFQKIAADKAQFEDMMGFPNPKSLADGKIEYATTPISIWDKRFILIDEISRCNPQLQNKFLEIVLDRQLMGLQTDIKWVWATMNPLDYPGSQPLDGALAGRMGYVLQIKETIKQHDSIVERVVSSRNYAQTPALEHWTDETRAYHLSWDASLRDELKRLMFKSGQILAGLDDHWTPVLAKYITAFAKALMDKSALQLDGRRLVMMRYNIIANIAVQTVQTGRALTIQEIKELCAEVLPLSVPWTATGIKDTFDAAKFKEAHKLAAQFLDSGDNLLYRIITEQSAIEKAKLFLENRERIESASATNLIASLYDPIKQTGTRDEFWQEQAERFFLHLALAQLFLRLPNVPAEAISLVSKHYPVTFRRRLQEVSRSSSALVTFNSQEELSSLTREYKALATSNKPYDWAIAYWAFQYERGTWSYQEIWERLDIAREAFWKVHNELSRFLPAVPASPNGVIPNVLSASSAATDDQDDQGQASEAAAAARSVGGTAEDSGRLAVVV